MAAITMTETSDNPYLGKSHVFSKSYNSDKSKETFTWKCWPQEVPYSYTYYGKSYSGYYTGGTSSKPGGILRGSNLTRYTRRGIFEGIRIHQIRWRKNGGTWKTKGYSEISNESDATVSVSTATNGDKFEIQVTYELCTMGFPHRNFPFFWFCAKGSTYYVGGNGKSIKYTKPNSDPGRSYSKVSNTAWEKVRLDWGDPRDPSVKSTDKTLAGWSYKNGKAKTRIYNELGDGADKTAYSPTYTYEYQTHYPQLHGLGWKSEAGNDYQYARKSAYWTYRRTFTYTVTSSDIKEAPDPVEAPNKPEITVVPNHCSTDLRGEEGTVKVKYTHPSNYDGEILLYAFQFNDKTGEFVQKRVGGGYIEIDANETYQYTVNFKDLGFTRSKEIRYMAVARIHDNYYNVVRQKATHSLMDNNDSYTQKLTKWNVYAKGHYFNEEPVVEEIHLKESLDYTKKATLYWDRPIDPDGDKVHYSLCIARPGSEWENDSLDTFYGGNYGGVNGDVLYSYRIDNITTTTYDLDTTSFPYLEDLKVWLVSYDDYINSYYYASRPIEFKKVQSPYVKIECEEIRSGEINPTNNDDMIDGTRGKVKLTYYHEKCVGGTVDLEIYQPTDYEGTNGYKKAVIKNVASFTGSNGLNGETKEYIVDFKQYSALDRSKDINYFVKATDANGTKSWLTGDDKWENTVRGHYYNDEPAPVYPALDIDHSESRKDFAHLIWDLPIDPDYDSKLWYAIYLATGDSSKDTNSKEFGKQKTKMSYYKVYYTTATEYYIDITDFTSSTGNLSVWIESHDQKWNDYYHYGTPKQFQNTATAPNKPYIVCYNMYDELDGLKCSEQGEVYIYYSHDQGWSGYVKLYAMGKYKDGSFRVANVFEKQLGKEEVLIQDGSPYDFVVDFRKVFGNEWTNRDCEVHYYATARTANRDLVDAASSEGDIDWVPTVANSSAKFNSWDGAHYYNDEPSDMSSGSPAKLTLGLDDANSDIFTKVRLKWSTATDVAGDIVRYEVYLKPEHKIYTVSDEIRYFNNPDPDADEAIRCDLIGITNNTFLDFDMTGYEVEGETYTAFIRAVDGWHNSYYYDSNKLVFTKKEYSRPKTKINIENAHGEFGKAQLIYTHPDSKLTGEDATDRGSCDGKVWVYAYIDGYESRPINISSLFGDTITKEDKDDDVDYIIMTPDQTIDKTIDFREIVRLGKEQNIAISQYRSNYITYYAIAKDVNPGIYSIDTAPDDIGSYEREEYLSQTINGVQYFYTHYFNEEPPQPVPYTGSPLTEADRAVFGFNYTVIQIEPISDPDRDPMHYYIYIDTPNSMGDAEHTTKIYKEVANVNTKDVVIEVTDRIYNRCYRIDPIYEKTDDTININNILYYNIYKLTGDNFDNNSSWTYISKSDTPSLKIDYIADNYPLSKWIDGANGLSQSDGAGLFTYWVESRDDYENSYYRSSDSMIIDRIQHKKPNKPELIVTPAHGERGDISIKYKHPEQLDSLIYLYAYFTDSKGVKHSGLVDVIDVSYTDEEKNDYYLNRVPIVKEVEYTVEFTKEVHDHTKFFERSTAISYYAVAADKIVGYISELEDTSASIDDFNPDSIAEADRRDGHYFNEEPEISSPYYLFTEKTAADEGDSVFEKGVLDSLVVEETPFDTMTLLWEMPATATDNKDIDGDIIDYYFYMYCPSTTLETKNKDEEKPDHVFYGNYTESDSYGGNDVIQPDNGDAGDLDEFSDNGQEPEYVKGVVEYNYLVTVPHEKIIGQTVSDKNGKTWFYYTFDLSLYQEDGNVTIWIETRDRYENSYYRSGYSLTLKRGHKAKPIQTAYPNNVNNVVYCKRPRILIELAEDDLRQEVIVTWKNVEYSNKDYNQRQFFSSIPKVTKGDPGLNTTGENDCYVIFRPPVAYTEISGSKVQYSIKVNNTCTTSESRYFSYMYYKFGYNLTEDTFIPIKAVHVNEFRKAAQRVIDAYGKSYEDPGEYQLKDRAVVIKQIVDNEDYNEIAKPLMNLNNFLNTCDKCDNDMQDITDDVGNDGEQFVDMAQDYEVIGPYFEGDNTEFTVPDNVIMDVDYHINKLLKIINSQDYYMTSDFIDWKILLYILQNM